jgi:hypothetical protein
MCVKLTFDYQWPDISDRAIKRIHKEAGNVAMQKFAKDRLKFRFNGKLATELKWEPRSEKYEKRKAKRGSAGTPHVYTRKTARSVLGGGYRIIASANMKKATYSLRLTLKDLNPGYKRRPDPGRPNMNKEIIRLTDSELQQIATDYTTAVREGIQTELNTPRRRGRIS